MATRYHLNQFPPRQLDWEQLISRLGPTRAAIARYDGILSAVVNPDILLSPLITREAVLSSRIEGTQATMGDVLEFEAGGDCDQYEPSRVADIHEILNYRQALREAESLLNKLPLSQRVLKSIHAVLLDGVRGQHKSPGEYRRVQNWIGPPGCAVENAYYVPVEAEKLQRGMDVWENFIHTDFPDTLVQLALLHVEFEALHPFLDGNGRLGRLFIPLFLWQKDVLSRPTFYISAFFERERNAYYEKLRAVSEAGAWTEWCIFFLDALRAQADENTEKAKGILALYEDMKRRIPDVINSRSCVQVVDNIFASPIFAGSEFRRLAGISSATSRRTLGLLVDEGILRIMTPPSGRRSAIYCFPRLLNLAEGSDCF